MSLAVGSKAPVPSKSLLRFLRSQSHTGCLSNSSPGTSHHPANRTSFQYTGIRPLSTSSSCAARHHHEDTYPRYRENAPKALPPPRYYQHPSIHHTPHTRHASTKANPRPSFFRRIFSFRRRSDTEEEDPIADVPFSSQQYEDTSAQLFNLSRALSRSPSGADLKLRCTEFDANGSVTLVSGEFKKSELIAKYGLLPRDLRKIDSSVLPHILVRPSAILINLLHLRVLIQSDRVLVFDAYGSTDSYTQSLFMYDLEGKLAQKADPRNGHSSSTYLPYELRALEAVLISATSGLEAEFTLVRDPVVRVLRALESDIDRDKLRHLLIHSKKLGTFEQKARLVRDAINDLLEADDDLAAMYLTERKQTGQPRPENEHQEVEMLLESYHKICDEIVEISGNLISNIRNTEEVVRAILDSNRNQLMLLDLKFSIGTLGLAGGTLIAGLYGMNLNNFIEETDFGFGGVTAVCFGLSAIICVYGMRKLGKVQKVRMWGEGEGLGGMLGDGRGNWRSEAIEHAALAERFKRVSQLRFGGDATAKMKRKENMKAGVGGPVLWPGMEGLGMHKLEMMEREEEASCGRVGDGTPATGVDESGPSVTIHDDISGERALEAKMKERAMQKRKEMAAGKKG